jgi:hypothetical protein
VAKAALRLLVPKECHKYIQANSPCKKIDCWSIRFNLFNDIG